MDKFIRKLVIRNTIELLALTTIACYLKFTNVDNNYFLIPLLIVGVSFVFNFYKIIKFKKDRDDRSFILYQSKFLSTSYAWYFAPLFALIYIDNSVKFLTDIKFIVPIGLLYLILYWFNFKASKEILKINQST